CHIHGRLWNGVAIDSGGEKVETCGAIFEWCRANEERMARIPSGVARMRSVWREFQVASRECGAYGANSKWRRANAGRMARILSGVARMRSVWREFWVASRDWEAYGANFGSTINSVGEKITSTIFLL